MTKKQELVKILDTIERGTKHIRDRLDTLTNDIIEQEIDMIANQIKFLLAPI